MKKNSKYLFTTTVAVLIMGGFGVTVNTNTESAVHPAFGTPELQAANPDSLRNLVDRNCGICHNNVHFRAPGEFSLANAASAKTPGVFAQSLGITDPTAPLSQDQPETALIFQKPFGGLAHGGPKISSGTAVAQAIIAWIKAGRPNADLDYPAQPSYAYKNASGNQHEIVYTRRPFKAEGFNGNRGSAPGGQLWHMIFDGTTNAIISDTLLVDVGSDDDVQTPTVSLDGSKIAFSRKHGGEPWQIWEVGIDGSGLRQITTGPGNKIDPNYLPWNAETDDPARAGEGGILFLSDASEFLDEYDQGPALSLFVCDANGGHLRQIDFNPSHQLNPSIDSNGVVQYTRWEHNENQRENFMAGFQISGADYISAGTNLFGLYGEHGPSDAGNSLHEISEILPIAENGQYGGDDFARGSNRNDAGGSIVGPFFPRLQGDEFNHPHTNMFAKGDNTDDKEMKVDISSITYREPRSLLKGLFTVSVATLTGVETEYSEFTATTKYHYIYGNWELHTFTIADTPDGPRLANDKTLLQVDGLSITDAVPVLIKPQPGRKGKPVDLTMNTGIFVSGNVTDRQNDGQPKPTLAQVKYLRVLRGVQLAQGRVETGVRRGLSTIEICRAPIMEDGSVAVEVPAEAPVQFQLLDKDGLVLVNHKPWVQTARGETMRCVGCHAEHDKPAVVQTLLARQQDPYKCDVPRAPDGINFARDIDPWLTQLCMPCHDSALPDGAAAHLDLSTRPTLNGVTHAYATLIAREDLVVNQDPSGSRLIQVLIGRNPYTGEAVKTNPDHTAIVANYPEFVELLKNWIGIGFHARKLPGGRDSNIQDLDKQEYLDFVEPFILSNCTQCHVKDGGAGLGAFDFRFFNEETRDLQIEDRELALADRINFVIPEASTLLRVISGGESHVGGQFITPTSPEYQRLYRWIAKANPAAPSVPPTDLVNVQNYPNPFRDKTLIVYKLQGTLASKVTVEIYSPNGKLIRSFDGDRKIGFNTVQWDGRGKDGKVVSNDWYVFVVDADFVDGTHKEFRGKCVKVR